MALIFVSFVHFLLASALCAPDLKGRQLETEAESNGPRSGSEVGRQKKSILDFRRGVQKYCIALGRGLFLRSSRRQEEGSWKWDL